MKAITEAMLRCELKYDRPEIYYIKPGQLLTPAAREYLNQLKIEIGWEKDNAKTENTSPEKTESAVPALENIQKQEQVYKPKYVDFLTGAGYVTKPEHMTQLAGNRLVDKNHPRIKFRGKLDTLQSLVVFIQASAVKEEKESLIEDLSDILRSLQELMRCEVMDEKFTGETIIGLTHDELRAQSHNPMKYYNIKQMTLPHYSMGITYSMLNMLRSGIREAEVTAVDAFMENKKFERGDIIEELNRLSSALHIMMCRHLAGYYAEK